MDIIKVGPFEVTTERARYIIGRGKGGISLTPGEGDTAINVVLQAVTLRKLKVLPEKVSHTPFEVQFTPERILHLTRKDSRKERVAFKFEEGDMLVEAIKQGANKLKDITTIQGAPGGGVSHYQVPDSIVEGR